MDKLTGYAKLLMAAALVVLVTVLVYLAEKKTRFGKMKPAVRQTIIGILYGGLAVLATEYGISIEGAVMNVRDAAPLCAGLIFGAPAGIIAGVIGGVERFFAVYWGAGEYTRIACSISTVLAGMFSAVLRTQLFDDKKPSWFYGLATGLVMEVLHMLMLFVTNMDDVRGSFNIVRICSGPMILFNGLAVMLAVLVVTLIGKEPVRFRQEQKRISQAFQRWLLICVIAAFVVTCAFTITLQTRLSYSDADRLLALNIEDVRADIMDASDENLLSVNRTIAKEIDNASESANLGALISVLQKRYSVAEIDVINKDGIITACTNPGFVGYNMADGEQSAEFLVLLSDKQELVQAYQPISYDQSLWRKYAGVALKRGGFVQVGYDSESFQRDIATTVVGVTRNRHVGENGCIIICDENWLIVSDRNNYEGQNLDKTGIWIDRNTMPEGVRFSAEVYGESSYCMYTVSEGYTIVAVLPQDYALFTRDVSVYIMAFMEIILFAALFILIYYLIKRIVVNNIVEINNSLAKITGGNLNVTVNVRSSYEFASLSDDINSTIFTLKRYIAEAAARIDQELEFARTIQHAALPSAFPPFPGREEFELFASMDAAKEVGGDFFDFYLVDEEKLAFMIADVSGKGIPAAMFMMTAKTLIKSLAEKGLPANEVLSQANNELCSGNEAGMFVTVWLGVLNTRTGAVSYASAGHNPPLVERAGRFEYEKCRAGLVLAGMEGIRYRQHELTLNPGETLFLYTDGVTEATDCENRLYGEERLKARLDSSTSAAVEEMAICVRDDIDLFVGEAPQFDDITMLVLRYRGMKMKRMEVEAREERTAEAAAFVEDALSAMDCPIKLVYKMNIAFDELFSNIVRHSGAETVQIDCGVNNGRAELVLTDDGTPFDPTEAAKPNTTLPASERELGGLGIHMVFKLMDTVDYSRTDNHNILRITKRLD